MGRLKTYLSFIRFSHTVFALPFALTGALLAWRENQFSWAQLILIVICMVCARTAAMGFNRLVDARFDALNPRTALRELPTGAMTSREGIFLVVGASAIFIAAAGFLNPLCFALSPLALVLVFWYSVSKRYTPYTQLFLGLAMAIAPVGGWFAAGGGIGWQPWLLGVGVGLWVGGFDILYACQDFEFDRSHGLKSIPASFGISRAIYFSRAMHVGTVTCLGALSVVADLSPTYLLGVMIVAVLLIYEQSLVSVKDLSQVKRAFDINGWVGIMYFISTAYSIYYS